MKLYRINWKHPKEQIGLVSGWLKKHELIGAKKSIKEDFPEFKIWVEVSI
jgi:hypothetical protein